MGVSYNRLWKMLIDKNMKRIEMQYLTGISGNILARMGKNQYVSIEQNGYLNDINKDRLHHEIYMSDARKVAPDKWKTVIRHPIKKA